MKQPCSTPLRVFPELVDVDTPRRPMELSDRLLLAMHLQAQSLPNLNKTSLLTPNVDIIDPFRGRYYIFIN